MRLDVHPESGIPHYNCTFSLSPNHQTPLVPLQDAKQTHQRSVPHSPLQHSDKKGHGFSHLVLQYRFLDGMYQGLKMSLICLPSGHLWWLLALCGGSSCQHRAVGTQQPGTQSSTQRCSQSLQLSHLTLIVSPRLSRTLSGKPVFLSVSKQGGLCGWVVTATGGAGGSVIPPHNSPSAGSCCSPGAELSCWDGAESAWLSTTECSECECVSDVQGLGVLLSHSCSHKSLHQNQNH